MLKFVWPKDQIGLRIRVVVAVCLLIGAKVGMTMTTRNVQIPTFNPCADELFVSIFHSFEAAIANATSSLK